MAKSIMQSRDKRCYFCGRTGLADPLDSHHIYGGPNRNNSEKYGLKVYLCHHQCHIFGPRSVHQCAEVNNELKAIAQQYAMDYYGWTVDDFRRIFGKNYL